MSKQVIVRSDRVILSEKAAAFAATPAPIMGFIEDIYAIRSSSVEWFVVYTNPQHEEKVVQKLDEMKIEAFMPQTTEWKPRTRTERDQKKPLEAISRPLLSRYLFAYLPVADRSYRLVQDIEGVRTILGNGERKIPVPAPFVEYLRQRQDAGDFNRTEKRGRVVAPKWAKEGVEIMIKDGPFAGFAATIMKCLPRHQVEVAFAIFGRPTSARMPMEQIVESAA